MNFSISRAILMASTEECKNAIAFAAALGFTQSGVKVIYLSSYETTHTILSKIKQYGIHDTENLKVVGGNDAQTLDAEGAKVLIADVCKGTHAYDTFEALKSQVAYVLEVKV